MSKPKYHSVTGYPTSPTPKLKKITTRYCPEELRKKKGSYCSKCGCLIATKEEDKGKDI